MEIDYSLFEDQKEINKENYNSNDYKQKKNIKIFILSILIILGFIILYTNIIENYTEIHPLENNEIIAFVNKYNKTGNSWNILNKFNKVFKIYKLYNYYDTYIGTPLNITNKIKEFLI